MSKETSWSFEEKIALATELCLDRRLSHAEYRVGAAMLLYFHNSASGALATGGRSPQPQSEIGQACNGEAEGSWIPRL
jgi:hypothetical protein